MKIEKNSMVKYHYKLTDADSGELLESTYESQANSYIHGVSDILKGLENALDGKASGEFFDVKLPAAQAYGQYNPDAVGRVSLNYVFLPGGRPLRGKLQAGDDIEVRTEYGVVDGTVIKQGLKTADIDTNHPYAGKALNFAVEVVDVRAAKAEELSGAVGCGGCSCCA